MAKGGSRNMANLLKVILRSHKWSMTSLILSLGVFMLQRWLVDYYLRRGTWVPYSPFADKFGARVADGMLTSLALAIIALFKERPPWLGLVAFAVAGFLIFALGYAA